MKYNDGVKMNGDLRVEICPVCGNEEFSDDSEYCKICGNPVYNTCLGTKVYHDFDDFELVTHKNTSNARFCEKCGQKTEFFDRGILKSWKDSQKQVQTNDEDIPF